jgi:hypothetical protein
LGAKRRRIEAGLKAKVALAAVRGDRTASQLGWLKNKVARLD